jgi:hypothetical protein
MSAVAEPGDLEIWYRLDSQDRIVGTGGAWIKIASDGSDRLAAERVIGTSIYVHVAGHFTRKFLQAFLAQARVSAGQVRQTYRCDSPDLKRFVEMRAMPEGCDRLLVSHQTVDEQPLPFRIQVLQVSRQRASRLRCSICNRLRRKSDGVWREPEDSVHRGDTALVIHTVCEECRRSVSGRRAARAPETAAVISPRAPTSRSRAGRTRQCAPDE